MGLPLPVPGPRMLLTDPHARARAGYVAPFVTFVLAMTIEKSLGIPAAIGYPIRFALTLAVILLFSRDYITLRPRAPLGSVLIGMAVLVIWIGPDQFFGYRHSWLFENSLTGRAESSLPADLRANVPFLILRCVTSFALVPVLEELFWRGWLMRWLIERDFRKVPLGTYQPMAFWLVAALFASEHGPFWEVGLVAGAIYNWWLVRTRNLADCILAHGVTNALLCAWVVYTGHWEYWL